MRWKGWDRIPLRIPDPSEPGRYREVMAVTPLIISASRSTDIPAYYGDWFMHRLNSGYVAWKSPFGRAPVYISFMKTRLFAFWSKNPAPFLPEFGRLDRMGYGSLLLFTLNEYSDEGLEPGIPTLQERIATFKEASRKLDPGRVIWRFDPLLLSDTISVDDLLERLRLVGDQISTFTRRLFISFIDIARYRKVQRNLTAAGRTDVRELSGDEIVILAEGLAAFNERWKLSISTCGEQDDLSEYGIRRDGCIGYGTVLSEFAHDRILMEFLNRYHDRNRSLTGTAKQTLQNLKDPGQRNLCRCIVSRDIGQYSTCPHGCLYCYANSTPAIAQENHARYRHGSASGIFRETILG